MRDNGRSLIIRAADAGKMTSLIGPPASLELRRHSACSPESDKNSAARLSSGRSVIDP